MRVASKTVFDAIKYNLNSTSAQMSAAYQVVSSGKRISKPSDDPIGLAQTLDIRASLAGVDQIQRNLNMGKTWLDMAESVLDSVQNILSEAKSIAVQMASTTQGSSERLAAAKTVENLMAEIVSLGNTDVGGRYIFAGSKTGTKPFADDGAYSGDTNPFAIRIGQNSTLTVGGDGSAVFGSVFTVMANFKTALENNDVVSIQAATSSLEDSFDSFAKQISDVGSRTTRVEIKEKIIQDLKFSYTDQLANIEEADIAEAIIELESKSLAYQAALASASKVMQMTLIDYL